MKRTKTTIAAAVAGVALAGIGIPAALAANSTTTTTASAKPAPSPTSTATPTPSPTPTKDIGCGYPSNRTPTLVLNVDKPSLPKGGGSVVFSGSLTSNKCVISNSVVSLYSKVGNNNPVKVGEALTDTSGNYTFSPTSVTTTTTFASYYVPPANSIWDGTVSNTVLVSVKQ